MYSQWIFWVPTLDMWHFARQSSLPSSSCSFFCNPDSGPELALGRGASLPRPTDQTKKHQNCNIKNASSKWHVWCKLSTFCATFLFFAKLHFANHLTSHLQAWWTEFQSTELKQNNTRELRPLLWTWGTLCINLWHQHPNLPASTIFRFDMLPPWVATFAFALAHGCK